VNPLPAPPTPPLELCEATVKTSDVEEIASDFTPESSTLSTSHISESEGGISAISVTAVDPPVEPSSCCGKGASPAEPTNPPSTQVVVVQEAKSEGRDTIQVQVEVHLNAQISHENPTPEDIYEQEIQSFNGVEGEACPPLGKRENIEKGRRCLHIHETPESGQSKSEEPPCISTGGEESVERDEDDSGQGQPQSEVDLDPEGDYVFLKLGPPMTKSQKQSHLQEEDQVAGDSAVPFHKAITAPSIFDPFALLEFKTDEFIAAENEALIRFNQQLQDEIVREEEEIEELIRQIQEINLERGVEYVDFNFSD